MSRPPLIGITAFETKHINPPHVALYATGQRYVSAVEDAGGLPVVLSPGLSNETLHQIFDRLDGLLLSGGGDIDPALYGERPHPQLWGLDMHRDRAELALASRVVEKQKPVLCICRGIQVLNVALGGTLVQDIPSQMPQALAHSFDETVVPRDYLAHQVKLEPNSRLAAVIGSDAALVNSWHHQSIKRVADTLKVVATAPDGVVEAVEVPGQRFAIGVQWHPEWLYDTHPEMKRLFTALIEAASHG